MPQSKSLSEGRSPKLLLMLLLSFIFPVQTAEPATLFRSNSVVAWAGGADVVTMMHSGHLETLITAAYPNRSLKFRNFGWEGDTVYQRPRDYGFPPLRDHLHAVGADVIFLQFGRSEALGEPGRVEHFSAAYGKLLDDLAPLNAKLILVTPPPFEDGPGLLPKLASRNDELGTYATAICELAARRDLICLDLFTRLNQESHALALTDNGLQLTHGGQARIAEVLARALELPQVQGAEKILPDGNWADPQLEELRRAIVEKNQLWFHYWRPQNWAFLGGDRVDQPSSRDHRDPKTRWFPDEMKKFVPLIEAKEQEIASMASRPNGGVQ